MPLTKEQQSAVLSAARALIGTKKYSDIDCSHFVHSAYATAGVNYAYQATATFKTLVGQQFVEVNAEKDGFEPADVLMFSGHMGLWDADGCKVLQEAGNPNAECGRFNNQLPFLSSRSGSNRGPDYGMMKWFGGLKAVYRWK